MIEEKEKAMSKKTLSWGDIINYAIEKLTEREKELDRLINELRTLLETLGGDADELGGKMENAEERVTALQNQITRLQDQVKNLSTYLLTSHEMLTVPTQMAFLRVILRCEQWKDFQIRAYQAQTLSFSCKETEKSFQVDALKNDQLMSYSGALPKQASLLKTWLSKQLNIPEKQVLEGILAVR